MSNLGYTQLNFDMILRSGKQRVSNLKYQSFIVLHQLKWIKDGRWYIHSIQKNYEVIFIDKSLRISHYRVIKMWLELKVRYPPESLEISLG